MKDPVNWPQVEAIFHAVLERPAEARAAYLHEVCGKNDELRREIEALLAYENETVDLARKVVAPRKTPAAPPSRIGAYELSSLLGKGGMGEVWLAYDERLRRKVAIKLLPAGVSRNATMVARFEREARAASALNHPNILTIYDIGQHDGAPYIVEELLEGEELRAHIKQGALALKKVIEYAGQIAAGLSVAHEKGIVHRDLKPENIFVTKDSRVKILDFGLAKLREKGRKGEGEKGRLGENDETLALPPPLPHSPSPLLTAPGVVMGTVSYMSPEQARGQEADHRSDIFSFGVILYEMLSGKRPFTGESAIEVMNAILKEDPPELSESNAKIPPALDKLVRRCLEKKPEHRFQSTSDLGFALQSLTLPANASQEAMAQTPTIANSPWFSNARWAWLAAAVCLLGLLAALVWGRGQNAPTSEPRVLKADLLPPKDSSFDQLAVSPDGRWLAFTAATGGKVQLWLRALNSTEAKPFAGTEGARLPFWSPDSRFIGFIVGSKLKKIEVGSERSVPLCDVGNITGCAWGSKNVILFSTRGGVGISRVSADGGEVKPVVRPDLKKQETDYHFPAFLPDGQQFLFLNNSAVKEARGVYLASLDGTVQGRVLAETGNALFAPSGQGHSGKLLFVREGMLMAQTFDAAQQQLTGEPYTVAERVAETSTSTLGVTQWNFSVSENGLLVFDPLPGRQANKLMWVERNGQKSPPLEKLDQVFTPRLSPDGKRIAVSRAGANTDVWLLNAQGLNATRFTFEPSVEQVPIWSPDSRRLAWSANPNGVFQLFQKSADGAGQPELLYQSEYFKFLSDWSRDGRFIFYREIHPQTKFDIWYLDLSQGLSAPKAVPYLQAPANEIGSVLSPDGRWLAYASDESGKFEIYVQSFPHPGSKRQISAAGGYAPLWRSDGKELFYHAPDGKLIAVSVQSGTTLETVATTALFEFRTNGNMANTYYDVTKDGQRFLLSAIVETETKAPLTLVQNWMTESKR